MENEFVSWLQSQLDKRDWSQAELSRKSGISTPTISRIFSGTRNVGPDVCKAFARALKLPLEEVYRQAGILPPESKRDAMIQEIEFIYNQLTEENKTEILAQSRFRLELQEKKGSYGSHKARRKSKALD